MVALVVGDHVPAGQRAVFVRPQFVRRLDLLEQRDCLLDAALLCCQIAERSPPVVVGVVGSNPRIESRLQILRPIQGNQEPVLEVLPHKDDRFILASLGNTAIQIGEQTIYLSRFRIATSRQVGQHHQVPVQEDAFQDHLSWIVAGVDTRFRTKHFPTRFANLVQITAQS